MYELHKDCTMRGVLPVHQGKNGEKYWYITCIKFILFINTYVNTNIYKYYVPVPVAILSITDIKIPKHQGTNDLLLVIVDTKFVSLTRGAFKKKFFFFSGFCSNQPVYRATIINPQQYCQLPSQLKLKTQTDKILFPPGRLCKPPVYGATEAAPSWDSSGPKATFWCFMSIFGSLDKNCLGFILFWCFRSRNYPWLRFIACLCLVKAK